MSVMSENDMEKRRKDATGAIKRLKQLTERDMNLRCVLRRLAPAHPDHNLQHS